MTLHPNRKASAIVTSENLRISRPRIWLKVRESSSYCREYCERFSRVIMHTFILLFLYLKCETYISIECTITFSSWTIGGAVVGTVVAPYAAPVLLGSLGFGAGGIAAGSVAASMMSAAATANGGAIAAGSVVALLQAAGATGIGIISSAAISTMTGVIGATVGAGVGGGFSSSSSGRSSSCTDISFCQ